MRFGNHAIRSLLLPCKRSWWFCWYPAQQNHKIAPLLPSGEAKKSSQELLAKHVVTAEQVAHEKEHPKSDYFLPLIA